MQQWWMYNKDRMALRRDHDVRIDIHGEERNVSSYSRSPRRRSNTERARQDDAISDDSIIVSDGEVAVVGQGGELGNTKGKGCSPCVFPEVPAFLYALASASQWPVTQFWLYEHFARIYHDDATSPHQDSCAANASASVNVNVTSSEQLVQAWTTRYVMTCSFVIYVTACFPALALGALMARLGRRFLFHVSLGGAMLGLAVTLVIYSLDLPPPFLFLAFFFQGLGGSDGLFLTAVYGTVSAMTSSASTSRGTRVATTEASLAVGISLGVLASGVGVQAFGYAIPTAAQLVSLALAELYVIIFIPSTLLQAKGEEEKEVVEARGDERGRRRTEIGHHNRRIDLNRGGEDEDLLCADPCHPPYFDTPRSDRDLRSRDQHNNQDFRSRDQHNMDFRSKDKRTAALLQDSLPPDDHYRQQNEEGGQTSVVEGPISGSPPSQRPSSPEQPSPEFLVSRPPPSPPTPPSSPSPPSPPSPPPPSSSSTCLAVKRSFAFYIIDTKSRRRLSLLVYLAAFLAYVSVLAGESNIGILYLLHNPFCWDPSTTTFFVGALVLLKWLTVLFFVTTCRSRLSEQSLALIGCFSMGAGLIAKGLAYSDTYIFVGAGVGLCSELVTPMCRTLMSRLVTAEEQGPLFAGLGVLQMLTAALMGLGVSSLYDVGLRVYLGLPYLVLGGLSFLSLFALGALSIRDRHNKRQETAIYEQLIEENEVDIPE